MAVRIHPDTVVRMHSVSDPGPQLGLAFAPSLVDFALMAESLPLLTQAVPVAEICRRALLALHGVRSAMLAGKDASGTPLMEQHRHAHYVPDCRGPDPLRMTHLVVYAPGGFAPSELRTMMSLSQLSRAAGPLAVVLQGMGRPDMLASSSRLFGSHRCFVSRTPFVLPRHRKRGDEPKDQLIRELRLRGLPTPIHVARMHGLPAPSQPLLPWSQFVIHRRYDELTTCEHGFGFRIEFAEPVSGPLLLGYGCHYGLGQFIGAHESNPPDETPLP